MADIAFETGQRRCRAQQTASTSFSSPLNSLLVPERKRRKETNKPNATNHYDNRKSNRWIHRNNIVFVETENWRRDTHTRTDKRQETGYATATAVAITTTMTTISVENYLFIDTVIITGFVLMMFFIIFSVYVFGQRRRRQRPRQRHDAFETIIKTEKKKKGKNRQKRPSSMIAFSLSFSVCCWLTDWLLMLLLLLWGFLHKLKKLKNRKEN